MRNIPVILWVSIWLLSCQQEPDVVENAPITSSPEVQGTDSRVFTLNPVAFKEAEFINSLPDGRQLTFVEPAGGFGFTSVSQGFDFSNSFSPSQVDQSMLRYGTGSLTFGNETYSFEIVTCASLEEANELFPSESLDPSFGDYQIITAFGGNVEVDPLVDDVVANYILILVIPSDINGSFIFPPESGEIPSIEFFNLDTGDFYRATTAMVTQIGSGISVDGIFLIGSEEVEFIMELNCG